MCSTRLDPTAAMPNRSEWIVIGISGVTCGGKTSLANHLKNTLTPVYVFHQDKYFYPDDSPHHIKCDGLEHNNYDIVTALDMKGMVQDMTLTMQGQNKAHSSYTRDDGDRFKIKGKKFLIAEGFTTLNYPPIMEMCDLRYYFILEYSECISRRVHRLYDPPDIDGYFEQCVWPEHIKYRAEMEKDGRAKLIDGAQGNAFDIVMADLRAMSS